MKLKYLGSYPYRKQPIIVEEWGNQLLQPNQLTHDLSPYEAKLIQERYKNVFVEVPEEKQQPVPSDKMLRKEGKNK